MTSPIQDFPIAIIGAGPGGLFTSMWLSKLGLKHVLLEGSSFPRDKSCGDVLPSVVLRSLNELDATLIPRMMEAGLLSPLSGTQFYNPANTTVTMKYKGIEGLDDDAACYSVRRAEFDSFLMEHVKESEFATVYGNTFIRDIKDHGDYYVLDGNKESYSAKLLIVAAGSTSSIPQKLGMPKPENNHFALGIRAYFKDVHCESDQPELYFDKSVFPGGVYIAPLSKGLYNVNLVIKKDAALKSKGTLEERFFALVENNPVLKAKFKDATMVHPFRGAGLYLGTKNRTVCGKVFMLVGVFCWSYRLTFVQWGSTSNHECKIGRL